MLSGDELMMSKFADVVPVFGAMVLTRGVQSIEYVVRAP